jgi:hypothetical protein
MLPIGALQAVGTKLKPVSDFVSPPPPTIRYVIVNFYINGVLHGGMLYLHIQSLELSLVNKLLITC